ncbi:hypothetical protein JAAARDRAFT_197188 [Jaapia argillacea MUCL 33604]|uniref:VIT domain-containing protein n=1 Tax=Jaapia argillacea MUCL 33604 TaxID=933084 RepID=A0A067PIS1_9AGAM|nr:hypothetical protein JAAARDRAFT_197188 [Jaapia argillacea MUCL 33604]
MEQQFAGIVHRPQDQTQGLVHLPLEEVDVKVQIVDSSARVTLTQTFSNLSDSSTGRAKYVFPVPSRAAVCAFEMETSSGRKIVGVCKAKEEATQDFENAVRAGRDAAIVEWVSDDVFTISLGKIRAHQTVVTKLAYVMDLMDDEFPDQVRFQLPMCVGERYGDVPPAMENASTASSATRIRITLDIQTSGHIQSVTSPTHTILLIPYRTHYGRSSFRRTTAKFRSTLFLERDFVLVVQAEGLDTPRCFAERARHPRGSNNGGNGRETIALQLTVVPKFELPPLPAQEYIFLVDRSGSMGGRRIDTAKGTLVMLLRMLPTRGTIFNIFSFGSQTDSLWESSVGYGEDTLNRATAYADSMEANYGGTEIRAALDQALGSRNTSMPTVAFVLTDGQTTDIDNTISTVSQHVASSSTSTPLRVFTLGIGEQVSSAMCEGIARAGNGTCLLAVTTESILGKCAKLVHAGRVTSIKDVTIDWGVREEEDVSSPRSPSLQVPSTSRRGSGTSRSRTRSRIPVVHQSPSSITSIYPGIRFTVFAIVANPHEDVPKEVTLRGKLDGEGDQQVEMVVPVTMVKPISRSPLPLIHTLAARRLITELEEDKQGVVGVPGFLNVDPQVARERDELTKAAIVRLGERYQLASRYTSFVAVDPEEEDVDRGVFDRQSNSSSSGRRRAGGAGARSRNAEESANSSLPEYIRFGLAYLAGWIFGYSGDETGLDQRSSRRSARLPGAWSASSAASAHEEEEAEFGEEEEEGEEEDGYDSADTVSTMSSLESHSSEWSAPPTPTPRRRRLRSEPTSPIDGSRQRSPSPSFDIRPQPSTRTNRHRHSQDPPPVPTEVVSLVRLQAFDGSFPLIDSLRHIVGSQGQNDFPHVDETLWATALAVAYLKKHLTGQPELLGGLLEKAMGFVNGYVGSGGMAIDFGILLNRAENIVV